MHRRPFSRLARAITISWIAWAYGLDEIVLAHTHERLYRCWRFLFFWRRLPQSRAIRLRQALERLGPLFVKLGQMLSTRRDLLPRDIADELAKLQDRVPPFDSDTAIAIIERELGQPLNAVFAKFEREPVASASIAQVHFAELKNPGIRSKHAAVKVLRPGMQKAIEKDLSLMYMMAECLEYFSKESRRLKPREVVAEFDKNLHDELDLVREAANGAQLARNMANMQTILVPHMYWDYCTSQVLVMQRMQGVPIGNLKALEAAGIDRKQLAKDGVTIFFTQVFRDGFFHADMHPGNILVSTEPETFGRYISLDFGIMGTLSQFDKNYLAHNFLAFFRRDYRRVAALHIESGWAPANTRVEELEAAVRTCCEPYFDRPLSEISLGIVLMRLFQTSRRFNVEIQPQLVLLQKTLLNIEGLGRELDPSLDLWATAKPFLESWMKEQVGFARLWRQLREEAPRYAELLPAMPRLIAQYLTHPPAQQPSHNELKHLHRSINRLERKLRMQTLATTAVLLLVIGYGLYHQFIS